MMMKNPVHLGKLVEANLEELGLSVAGREALCATTGRCYR